MCPHVFPASEALILSFDGIQPEPSFTEWRVSSGRGTPFPGISEIAWTRFGHVSGRLHVVMDDGSKDELGPGDVSSLPPGHNAWVVGDEPVVVIDISGVENYAKPK